MEIVRLSVASGIVAKLTRIHEEIEDLIEELEILSDEEIIKDLAESENDFEEGRSCTLKTGKEIDKFFSDLEKEGLMVQIELSEKFKNQMRKLKDEAMRDRVKEVFKDLLEDTSIGKPLRYSFKGFRSIRIGKYRLIYAVEGETVKIYAFERRKTVYRGWIKKANKT